MNNYINLRQEGICKMNLIENIVKKQERIMVIGLGYVGIPLAVGFAKKVKTIGFDIDQEKIKMYRNGVDPTNEVGNSAITDSSLEFTWDENCISDATFIIVTVPTPIHVDKRPNLNSVKEASRMIGRNFKKGTVVVYESTVYPGVTEDVCIPILEKESGLISGKDFKVGYSPERINPGDKQHRLNNIPKIVSGMDEETLEIIAEVYKLVIDAEIFKAKSIKVAESAKIAENAQRDINIAFMNELAMIFDHMDINTNEVINAMNTKWNALNFHPGLVGGHCIGIDPYYFIYEAEKFGYNSQIISAGRKVNDDMSKFIVEAIIKQLIKADKNIKESKVFILGITFKENCKDIRNSKVVDIIELLKSYEIEPYICDPIADKEEVNNEYKQTLTSLSNIKEADCIVFAVAHEIFKNLTFDEINKMYKSMNNNDKVMIDIKSMYDKDEAVRLGYRYWNL